MNEIEFSINDKEYATYSKWGTSAKVLHAFGKDWVVVRLSHSGDDKRGWLVKLQEVRTVKPQWQKIDEMFTQRFFEQTIESTTYSEKKYKQLVKLLSDNGIEVEEKMECVLSLNSQN